MMVMVGGRCDRHRQSVVDNREDNKNNNAVSKHHMDEEPTTAHTGKSGGRGGRAKNWTNIVRNESEQEGGSVGHTVNVKKSRATNDRGNEIRRSSHLGKREHVDGYQIESAEVTPTEDDVVVTPCDKPKKAHTATQSKSTQKATTVKKRLAFGNEPQVKLNRIRRSKSYFMKYPA